MFCKKCNAENRDDAKFCANCGSGLLEPVEQPVSVELKPGAVQEAHQEIPEAPKSESPRRHEEGRNEGQTAQGGSQNRKKRGRLVFLFLLAILIAGGVYLALKQMGGGKDGIAYFSDNELVYLASPESNQKVRIPIEGFEGDPSSFNLYFSPDHRYLYYFSNLEEINYSQIADLKRVEIAKLHPKVDIEKIAENFSSVMMFYIGFLDDGTFTYRKLGKDGSTTRSYYFDGKESHSLGKSYAHGFQDRIVGEVYKDGAYRLSFIDPKNLDNITEIAEYDDVILSYDNKYVFKEAYGEAVFDICEISPNKEKTLIAEDVQSCIVAEDHFFYTVKNESFRHQDQNYDTLKLFLFKDGQSTLIEENAVDVQVQKKAVLYNTLDLLKKTGQIEDESIRLKKGENHYIVGMRSAKPVLIRSFPEDSEYKDIDFFQVEDGVYLRVKYLDDTEELIYANAEGGEMKKFKPISQGYFSFYESIGDTAYLLELAGKGSSTFDLVKYHKGEKKTLAGDVEEVKWIDRDAKQILVSDWTRNDIRDLRLIDMEGNTIEKFDEVSDANYSMDSKNRFYYISDKDLFYFNGREKKKIASDVDGMWLQSYSDHDRVYNSEELETKWNKIKFTQGSVVGKWISTYMEENYVRYKFEGAIQMEFYGDGRCIVPPEAEGRWEKVSEGKYEISVNGNSSSFYVDVTESGVEAYMYIDNMKVFFTNDLENYVYPPNVYY